MMFQFFLMGRDTEPFSSWINMRERTELQNGIRIFFKFNSKWQKNCNLEKLGLLVKEVWGKCCLFHCTINILFVDIKAGLIKSFQENTERKK